MTIQYKHQVKRNTIISVTRLSDWENIVMRIINIGENSLFLSLSHFFYVYVYEHSSRSHGWKIHSHRVYKTRIFLTRRDLPGSMSLVNTNTSGFVRVYRWSIWLATDGLYRWCPRRISRHFAITGERNERERYVYNEEDWFDGYALSNVCCTLQVLLKIWWSRWKTKHSYICSLQYLHSANIIANRNSILLSSLLFLSLFEQKYCICTSYCLSLF